jgi:hypothetical protein
MNEKVLDTILECVYFKKTWIENELKSPHLLDITRLRLEKELDETKECMVYVLSDEFNERIKGESV